MGFKNGGSTFQSLWIFILTVPLHLHNIRDLLNRSRQSAISSRTNPPLFIHMPCVYNADLFPVICASNYPHDSVMHFPCMRPRSFRNEKAQEGKLWAIACLERLPDQDQVSGVLGNAGEWISIEGM
jgi:hypothetical protein